MISYNDLYDNERELKFIDKSGFCTTCMEKDYGCYACQTGKFKPDAE